MRICHYYRHFFIPTLNSEKLLTSGAYESIKNVGVFPIEADHNAQMSSSKNASILLIASVDYSAVLLKAVVRIRDSAVAPLKKGGQII